MSNSIARKRWSAIPASVRARVYLGFAMAVFVVTIVVAAAVWLTHEQRVAATQAQTHAETADLLNTAGQRGAAGALYMQLYVITGDETLLAASQGFLEESGVALNEAAANYREQGRVEDAAMLEAFLSQADEMSVAWGEAIALRQAGETNAALQSVSQTVAQMQTLGEQLEAGTDEENVEIQALKERADSIAQFALYSLLVIGLLAIVSAAAAAWALSRSVLQPLAFLQKTAAVVTSGNLEARAPESGPTELRELGKAFNDMTEALLDASKRRELEAQREVLVHDLHERVKELTAVQRVSRLVQNNPDLDEVIAGIAAILPPAMQYPESTGTKVTVNGSHETSINFADTPWVHRASFMTDAGQSATIAVCYHEEFPEADIGPFLTEEDSMLATVADILRTYLEQHDATQAAEQSIERFSKAFHASPAPISIVRARDGRVIDVNSAFLEVLGWSRDEALSHTIDELNIWADDEQQARFRDHFDASGSITHGEFALRARNGELRYAYGSSETIRLDDETCVLSIFYDVTARKQAESALHDTEQRWNSLVNNTSDLVSLLDMSGVLIYESPSVKDVLGYEQSELIGVIAFELLHPDDLNHVFAAFQTLLANPTEAQTVEFRFEHKDGSYRRLQAVGSALLDESGQLTGVVVVSRDVTEQRLMEERIAFQAHLLDASGEAVIATDVSGNVSYWNPAAEEIYRWPAADAIGTPIVEIISEVDSSSHDFELILEAVRAGTFTGEWNVRRKDGVVIPIESSLSPLTDENGEIIGVIGISRDINERKRAEDTIRHMAYHDALTGLPNRLLLGDRFDLVMAHAKRSSEKICVLSVDLDRFKIINDTLGHSTGDELLRAVANRLRLHAREGDTVARVGGDEFVILLSGCTSFEDGTDVAGRLVEAFREPFEVLGVECHTSLSVGVSFYPDDGETPETLLSAADAAMYAAKASGRDGFRAFGPDIDTHATDWLLLETDLRRALTRGEIIVFYQPQYSVETGEIIGVEALARWQHPENGLMPPSDFIKLAEESGLIVPLGEQVLARACSEIMAWTEAGATPVTLAVNVSLRQFERPDFVESVERILNSTHFPPDRLELEITETMALTNIDLTRAVAARLAEMGIRLALDDFGTGNTALRYLSDLPIDTLKIDQSFVRNLIGDTKNSEIAASVIALGHALSLNVIAEGVETKEQLEFLQTHHCDAFQGFLHSAPQPGPAIAEMLGAKTASTVS